MIRNALLVLALSVSLGWFAGMALADSGNTGFRNCGPCAGSGMDQECTTGACKGGSATVDGSTDCQYACCYGTNNATCGATDELQITPSP